MTMTQETLAFYKSAVAKLGADKERHQWFAGFGIAAFERWILSAAESMAQFQVNLRQLEAHMDTVRAEQRLLRIWRRCSGSSHVRMYQSRGFRTAVHS